MMHRITRGALSAVLALATAATAAACNGDQASATGPVVRGSVAAGEQQLVAPVLKRTVPLAHDLSASITVDGNGGVLRLPEAGLQVVVPPDARATSGPLTITVTAVAGDAVAYQFEPHGIVFARPLVATQDLGATTWSDRSGRETLQAAYFAQDADLDVGAGTAVVSELFPTDVVATGKRLHWDIPHFSGYVIVTGKSNR